MQAMLFSIMLLFSIGTQSSLKDEQPSGFYQEKKNGVLFTSVFNSFYVKILYLHFKTSSIYGEVVCMCVWEGVKGEECR